MVSAHDWALIAPWWNWPRPGVPARGRGTRPVFQKYDSPKLVETFLADPQKRLKFLDEVDRVDEFSGSSLAGSTRVRTQRRKLFQPNHFRHYLVVCSLHCDAPGLPPVDREQVCQQGFVIRKRALTATDADAAAARPKLAAVAMARRKVNHVDAQIGAARSAPTIPAIRLAALHAERAGAVEVLNKALAELRNWAAAAGVKRSLKGWAQGANEGEGAWVDVAEVRDALTEQVYPLLPLIVPKDKPHDAAHQTVYFGLVPTASPDHDTAPRRLPRFDDHSAYEIRCFVRRHAPGCLNAEGEGDPGADCRGQLVWSEPTDAFGLASHFDLRGTANRPINVQLPDLRQLRAQAGQFPTGVQFNTPPFSAVNGDGPTNGSVQICSFSIPLITIVAMFVFSIFLPIVVLLFQLWFLLLLKFCIPPELSLGGGLESMLDLDPGALDASFDLAVSASIDETLGLVQPGKAMASDVDGGYAQRLNNAMTRPERQSFLRKVYGKDAMPPATSDLVYETRVEWPEVVPA